MQPIHMANADEATTAQHRPILSVRNLKTYFPLEEGTVRAVDGVSFDLNASQTMGIVGESGCGKSITARSILGILDKPGRIEDGEILFSKRRSDGDAPGEIVDLTQLEPNGVQMRSIRGGAIADIFQEPMTSFSPFHTIGNQLIETIMLHRNVTKR